MYRVVYCGISILFYFLGGVFIVLVKEIKRKLRVVILVFLYIFGICEENLGDVF